ncbi:MAG: hypothetical protein ACREP9_21875, partial [Candidatus Dormibacteraceae bacterium]
IRLLAQERFCLLRGMQGMRDRRRNTFLKYSVVSVEQRLILTLAGEPGQTTTFGAARHLPAEGSIMLGNAVRVLPPGVQWTEGLVVRIIVRALVAVA